MSILKLKNPDGTWSGILTVKGDKGDKGETPVRGVDYWTPQDKQEIVNQTIATLPNNGQINKELDGLTTSSVNIPAGYTSGGSVKLTNSVEQALAGI